MEKRIELERRARKANQITELNLDNCRSTNIVGLTDEYTALESLSLINVGLTTLKGFPNLPSLKKLELSDNRISNGLNYLHTSPKLQYLNLSGNKIKDLEALKPLEHFKHLAVLDLFNNEATQTENYRVKMFEMLPSLQFLDGYDCNDAESPEEEIYSSEECEEEEDSEPTADDEDDNGDVSLSEVYNDDLVEDEDEWEEGNNVDGEGDEDDEEDKEDDEDSDENDEEVDTIAPPAEQKTESKNSDAEETHARGKKRKHEG